MEVRLLGHAVLVGQFAIDGVAESPEQGMKRILWTTTLTLIGAAHQRRTGRAVETHRRC
jgi:hypothetical protein